MFIRAKICYFVYIYKEKKHCKYSSREVLFGGPGNCCYTHTRLAMPNLVSIYADFEILDGWMPFRLKKIWAKDYIWSQIQTFFDINTIKFGRLS